MLLNMVLTIDRGNVASIAGRVGDEFPFLAPYARKPLPGCCGSAPKVALDGNNAVRQLERLPKDRRDQLKRLLGADVIRLRIVQAGRFRTVEL